MPSIDTAGYYLTCHNLFPGFLWTPSQYVIDLIFERCGAPYHFLFAQAHWRAHCIGIPFCVWSAFYTITTAASWRSSSFLDQESWTAFSFFRMASIATYKNTNKNTYTTIADETIHDHRITKPVQQNLFFPMIHALSTGGDLASAALAPIHPTTIHTRTYIHTTIASSCLLGVTRPNNPFPDFPPSMR